MARFRWHHYPETPLPFDEPDDDGLVQTPNLLLETRHGTILGWVQRFPYDFDEPEGEQITEICGDGSACMLIEDVTHWALVPPIPSSLPLPEKEADHA